MSSSILKARDFCGLAVERGVSAYRRIGVGGKRIGVWRVGVSALGETYRRIGVSACRRVGEGAFRGPPSATTPLKEHADTPTRRYADTCFSPCPVVNADGSVNVIGALG
jgi:hypothetical protein